MRRPLRRPLQGPQQGPQQEHQEPPPPRDNRGPQLEAGGSAVRHSASLQGNQRKAMLLRLSGMKILGSG